MPSSNDAGQSRRHFLRSVAVTGLATGTLSAVTLAQDMAEPTTFAFRGRVPGWLGVGPEEIADVNNPTLTLTPGETYRVVWRNADGEPHNFALLDADENPIQAIRPLQIEPTGVQGVFNNTTNITDVNVSAAVEPVNATGNATGNATDDGGGLVEVTQTISEEGAIQALEFEATEEMVEYYCQIHPTTMRGSIEFAEDGMGNNTTNSS